MATRAKRTESPLVVIVGPTASGKTALAVQLAREYGGEIICADSRTIYKEMDIGTAKPSQVEQTIVPHWGIDLVTPNERFTVADFKQYALEKIAEIRARGKIPFLVGGTGLYIDAILFDYQFREDGDSEFRQELEKLSVEELQTYCKDHNISLPENHRNKRYLIRTIEQGGVNTQRRKEPAGENIIVGIATEKDLLRTRIADRSEQILSNGVVEEAIVLGKKYGWKSGAMTGNIYPLVWSYLKNERNLKEVEVAFATLDWQLARRQLTWFRRNPHIVWLTREGAATHIRSALAT